MRLTVFSSSSILLFSLPNRTCILLANLSSCCLGSIAAGVHSTIGNVAAGSLFATLQSAGMGGYGVAVVNTVAQAVGGVGSIVAAADFFDYDE